ncbi:MAG TPA: ABC transporter permease, partial [Acidimicrobiales bacterium]|nr:ABC transporter permease [Acidimicrobiales bacterium]
DRPLATRYWQWVRGLVHGDMGTSYQYGTAVAPMIWGGLRNSLKLAALALLILVPISIGGGVIAALNVGRPLDRAISVVGLAGSTVPEFVSGIVVIVVFGIWLKILPFEAGDAGPSFWSQLDHLLLPALPLAIEFFGYIARITRAGTVEALDADYTRTAVLKGLPRRTVIMRHVLRNSLLPAITVIASQSGYLIGGLVVIEDLFGWHGLGYLILDAATNKDFPMLEAGVLTIGVIYMIATLLADVAISLLNPRIRLAPAAA